MTILKKAVTAEMLQRVSVFNAQSAPLQVNTPRNCLSELRL